MKRVFLVSFLAFVLCCTSVFAAGEVFLDEDFSAIDNWTFNSSSTYWPVTPTVQNNALVLEFKGTRRNSRQTISRELSSAVQFESASNVSIIMDVEFGENIPVAEKFPAITGTPAVGKIKKQNEEYVYYLTVDGTEYIVSTLSAGKAYTISYNLNYNVPGEINVSVTDKETGTTELSSISCTFLNNSFNQIEFYAYCADAAYPASAKITRLKVFDDHFGVSGISVNDGAQNVRADSEILIEFSNDIDTANSTGGISVKDSNGEIVAFELEYPQSDDIKLTFPEGLKYNTEYTLTLTDGIFSSEGKRLDTKVYTFKTELPPFCYGNTNYTDENDTVISKDNVGSTEEINANIQVMNISGMEKKLMLVLTVYKDGKLHMVRGQEVIIPSLEGLQNASITATGLLADENYSTQLFVWSSQNTPVILPPEF